jgi:hypothetical protein
MPLIHSGRFNPLQIGILPPQLKSIEQLFAGDVRFSVPRYQRSFSWTSEETQELWEDVIGAVQRNGEFFLGTVVLQDKAPEPQEIIDGQQRLACIAMLFSAIRNVFLARDDDRAIQIEHSFLGSKAFERNAVLVPKLVLNRINDATFRQYVLTSSDATIVAELLRDKALQPSNRLLLEAYQFFLDKVTLEVGKKGTQADDFLVPLIDTLRTKLKLITIPVLSDEDANLFFESLNARGKELAISDLVKNWLYRETKDQVDTAEQRWQQMENDLVRRPLPEFIRHYWIAKKAPKDSPMVREKHLYRMITKAVGGQQAALDLITDLKTSAVDYVRISDYTLWPDETAYDDSFKESLEDLRLFRVTQTNPLLLNVIQSFSTPKEIAKTLRFVANFAFRYFIVGNQSPGSLERLSMDIAYSIRAKTYTSASHIADALRAANPDPSFRSDFSLAIFSKSRAKIARYALQRINDHLARQTPGAEQIVDPNAKKVNLEHVLPQSVPAAWRSDFSSGVDPEEYVYRIGNLTLLNAKVNRTAMDKSFADKKSLALDASNLKINEFFKSVSTWGDQEIERRQDNLAKTALEVWKL